MKAGGRIEERDGGIPAPPSSVASSLPPPYHRLMNDRAGPSPWADPTDPTGAATPTTPPACERCGEPLRPGELACPRCGALAHRARLEQLSAEALRAEQIDAMLAARVWQQCLA